MYMYICIVIIIIIGGLGDRTTVRARRLFVYNNYVCPPVIFVRGTKVTGKNSQTLPGKTRCM